MQEENAAANAGECTQSLLYTGVSSSSLHARRPHAPPCQSYPLLVSLPPRTHTDGEDGHDLMEPPGVSLMGAQMKLARQRIVWNIFRMLSAIALGTVVLVPLEKWTWGYGVFFSSQMIMGSGASVIGCCCYIGVCVIVVMGSGAWCFFCCYTHGVCLGMVVSVHIFHWPHIMSFIRMRGFGLVNMRM